MSAVLKAWQGLTAPSLLHMHFKARFSHLSAQKCDKGEQKRLLGRGLESNYWDKILHSVCTFKVFTEVGRYFSLKPVSQNREAMFLWICKTWDFWIYQSSSLVLNSCLSVLSAPSQVLGRNLPSLHWPHFHNKHWWRKFWWRGQLCLTQPFIIRL